MYARLLVRLVVSLALYTKAGILIRGGGGRGGCIPGGLIRLAFQDNRHSGADQNTILNLLVFNCFKTSYKIEFIPRGNLICGRAYTRILHKKSKADSVQSGYVNIFLSICRKARRRL